MSKNLTTPQHRAIEALATGERLPDAASKAGVSLRTLYRWRNKPEFSAGLRAADADHMAETARTLNAASAGAITVLLDVMNDEKAAPGLRLRAAGEILKHRAAFYELVTLSDRLDALESAVFRGTSHDEHG